MYDSFFETFSFGQVFLIDGLQAFILALMRILTSISMLFLLLWLTGCASVVEQPSPQIETQEISWEDRARALSHIKEWDLKAVIAVRNNAKSNASGSANLQWHQRKQDYTLLLFGPLGAGSLKLTGGLGHVLLETADGKSYQAKTPELLLAEQTGWVLPVSNLYYWVRGLPVPEIPSQKKWDTHNRLIELNQQGWKIQFLSYATVQGVYLPNKIFLDHPQMSVKIIIKQWQI